MDLFEFVKFKQSYRCLKETVNTVLNVSMNIFVQRVTKASNVFFTKNILFCNIIIFILLLLFCNVLFLYYYYFVMFCSLDCKYKYFCTTRDKNFKCVSLKSILFKMADGISHVLVDRLTWNLKEIFTGCTCIAGTTNFKIWCLFLFFFFFFFFYHPKDEKHKENWYFNFKMLSFFFNFRNFAVSMVHAIAIFILIKIHFGILVHILVK